MNVATPAPAVVHLDQRQPRRTALPPALPIEAAPAFLARKIDAPPWVVHELIPAGGCTIVGGMPKTGKTFLTLDLAMATVTGKPFLGRAVDASGPVLLVDLETPPLQLQQRLRQMAAGRGLDLAALDGLDVLCGHRLFLDDQQTLDRLGVAILERRPRLIILDPLVRLHRRDENHATDMACFLGSLRSLTQLTGAGLVVVHHLNKTAGFDGRRLGAGLRGSGDLWGWYDAALFAKRDGMDIVLDFESRFTADQPAVTVQLEVDAAAARFNLIGRPAFKATRADRIFELLEAAPAGMTARALRRELRASNLTVRRALEELAGQGFAVEAAGIWTAVPAIGVGQGVVPRDKSSGQVVPPCPTKGAER